MFTLREMFIHSIDKMVPGRLEHEPLTINTAPEFLDIFVVVCNIKNDP